MKYSEKIALYVLVTYVFLNLLDVLLLPQLQYISPDNYLIPIVGICLLKEYYQSKVFQYTAALILIKIAAEFISNYLGYFSWSNFAFSGIWVKYFLFTWSCYYLMTKHQNAQLVDNTLIVFTVILILVNCVQLLRISDISKAIESIYVHRQELVDYNFAGFDGFRLNGTQTNPNDNGIMLLLLMCLFYLRKIRNKEIWAGVLVILILLTQSRTAFISLCFISFLYFLPVLKTLSIKKIILIISACFITFLLLIVLGFNTLLLLFDGSAFKSNSFMIRVGNVKEVAQTLEGNYLFGYGKIQSFQSFFGRSIDNELAFELAQFGIVGVVLYLLIISVMHFMIQGEAGKRRAFMFTGLVFLFGATNLSLLNSEVGVLFCIFFILLFFARRKPLKYYT